MKWLFVIMILLLIFPVSAFGEIHGFFEMGKVIDDERATAEIELQWWTGQKEVRNELYGGWTTWLLIGHRSNFPFWSIYTIGDRIHYKSFYFEIEHFCSHRVLGNEGRLIQRYDEIPYGHLTTISIGVEW